MGQCRVSQTALNGSKNQNRSTTWTWLKMQRLATFWSGSGLPNDIDEHNDIQWLWENQSAISELSEHSQKLRKDSIQKSSSPTWRVKRNMSSTTETYSNTSHMAWRTKVHRVIEFKQRIYRVYQLEHGKAKRSQESFEKDFFVYEQCYFRQNYGECAKGFTELATEKGSTGRKAYIL